MAKLGKSKIYETTKIACNQTKCSPGKYRTCNTAAFCFFVNFKFLYITYSGEPNVPLEEAHYSIFLMMSFTYSTL